MKIKEPQKVCQIKITLNYISPAIWRRIWVSEKTTLFELHEIIQIIFGWQDYHLHEFTINDIRYGDLESDEYEEMDLQDEMNYTLKKLRLNEGSHFSYRYDFGDSWDHAILIEKIMPVEKGVSYPQCIKGKRARPPEDVGGVGGYADFLEAIHDPLHEEHDCYLAWVGGAFDPEAFNLKEVNQRLYQYAYQDWPRDLVAPYNAWISPARLLDQTQWEESLTESDKATLQAFPLVKDVVAFLTYLIENKVRGTQSAGNLTRKAVEGIAARFVKSPELDTRIEDMVFHYRNENDIVEIYFVHVLAQGAGLISGGRGLRWQVTPAGEAFLSSSVLHQFLILFEAWWFRINWLITCSNNVFGTYLPESLSKTVLKLLRDLQTGSKVEFEPFVNLLIEKVGWTWSTNEPDHIRKVVYWGIEETVINPLANFGVLLPQYEKEPGFLLPHDKLSTFYVTEFGRDLLEFLTLNTK